MSKLNIKIECENFLSSESNMPNPYVTNVPPGHDPLRVQAAHIVELLHGLTNVTNVGES